MPVQRINMIRAQMRQTLRVVHIATQMDPFVTAKMRPGLSQVVGKVPAAQSSLGLETSVVLPLFRGTQELLAEQGQELEQITTLKLIFGPDKRPAEISTLGSPTEPQFPVYFIGNNELFGEKKMYGWTNDLERFAFFCHAAMELQRFLGSAPDIFDCHDWQSALVPVFLNQIQANNQLELPGADLFFDQCRSVLTIHDVGLTPQIAQPAFYQVHLGWERYLPSFAEFYGQLNPLKAGMYQAGRTIARSRQHILDVMEGRYGPPGFDGVASERFEANKLVGIWDQDSSWKPDQELSEELALTWAKRSLAVYRSVVARPFQEMEQAEMTTPAVTYRSLTTLEQLGMISHPAQEAFQKLNRPDKALVEEAIALGQASRFSRVRSLEDMRDVLSFLRIVPTAEVEKRMQQEGLGDFLEQFFAGDIDRIFSLLLTFNRCPALVEEFKDTRPDFKPERISLYDGFSRFRGADNTNLLDHTLGLLKSLSRISRAIELTDTELAEELGHRGALIGEESLARATADFRHFFAVLNYLSQEKQQRYFRAFIVSVLLHDIGKLVKHDTHAATGGQMLQRIRAFRGLLDKEELDFAKKMIQHHSIFGDIIVLREQNPDDMEELHEIFADRRLRDLAIKSLYILGIVDMDAIGHKGRLTPESIRKVRQAYHAVLFAGDKETLAKKLEDLGFGHELEGTNRWNRWVVREKDMDPKVREHDAERAAIELSRHCSHITEQEMQADLAKLSTALSRKQRKKIRRDFNQGVEERINRIKRQLGAIGNIRKMDYLTQSLEDSRHRARLLIWLGEYSQMGSLKNISFELSFRKKKVLQQELQKLTGLLEEFDMEKLTDAFDFAFDMENDMLEVYLPV